MSENNNNIELRSEKVRNVIGQIPSRIIRIGIAVIFIVFMALFAGAYFIKFDRTIDSTAKLSNENNNIHYVIRIPYNKLKFVKPGQKLMVTVHNDHSFTTTIQNIDSTLHLNNKQSYFQVYGDFEHPEFTLDEPMEGQSTVYVDKTNLIDYVLNN